MDTVLNNRLDDSQFLFGLAGMIMRNMQKKKRFNDHTLEATSKVLRGCQKILLEMPDVTVAKDPTDGNGIPLESFSGGQVLVDALEKLTHLYLNQSNSSPHVTARLAGMMVASLDSGERITDFRYEALEQILQACQRHLQRHLFHEMETNKSSLNS